MNLKFNFQATDINLQTAMSAFRGTSFNSDKKGQQVVESYLADMTALKEKFERFATVDNVKAIEADLEAYRKGYLNKLNAYLAAHSRCLSMAIAGRDNFPTRYADKRNETADKRRNEFVEWEKYVEGKLQRKYDPNIKRAISADDADAIEQIEAKLTRLESKQEFMKCFNAIVRKKSLTLEDKVEELLGLGGCIDESLAEVVITLLGSGFKLADDYMSQLEEAGFFTKSISKYQAIAKIVSLNINLDEDLARQILESKPRSFVSVAVTTFQYQAYQLTNNGAEIRRLKERLIQLHREQERGEVPDVVINGVTVSENRAENRLQLFFNGKPNAETITKLKAHGFKWAPSQSAWQRQLNDNARQAVQYVLKG